MSESGCTMISTTPADEMALVARKLRVVAALADENDDITVTFTAAGARAVAEAIDGGGWRGQMADEVAARVDAARAAWAGERDAWVVRCQRDMARARRELTRAQVTLGLVFVMLVAGVAVAGVVLA